MLHRLRFVLVWIWKLISWPARFSGRVIARSLRRSRWGKLSVVPAILLALVVSFLAYFVPTDAASRLLVSSEPAIITYQGDDPTSNTEVFYVGGAGSSPLAQVSELLPTLKKKAKSVKVVENARFKFDGDKVVDAVDAAMDPEAKELLVGASMGGLLVYDIIHKRQAKGDRRKFGAVLIDAPTDKDDVIGVPEALKTPSGLGIFSWLGVLSDYSVGPMLGFPPFTPGDVSKMSPNVNRQELEKSNRSYEEWMTSAWSDQGDYVFTHDRIVTLPNTLWVFIQSDKDTFVDGAKAYWKWLIAQGEVELIHVEPSGHMSFHDWPDEYATAVETGLVHVSRN